MSKEWSVSGWEHKLFNAVAFPLLYPVILRVSRTLSLAVLYLYLGVFGGRFWANTVIKNMVYFLHTLLFIYRSHLFCSLTPICYYWCFYQLNTQGWGASTFRQEMMGCWISIAVELPDHFLCVVRTRWSQAADLEEHPFSVFTLRSWFVFFCVCHMGWTQNWNRPPLVTGPDLRQTYTHQWQGHWCFILLIVENYSGKEIPIQLFPDSWPLHLLLSSHHGSDIVDNREASAKQGDMKRKQT